MWKLTFSPAAGFILNAGQDRREPGLLSPTERTSLRDLARRVAEIAAHPKQEEKRQLWYRHNSLEPVRPMLLVFPEDSWEELLPVASATAQDPFWRQWEWYLRHQIFRDTHLADDFVIEADLHVPVTMRAGDWGIKAGEIHRTEQANGSYNWTPPLREPDDIYKLRPATFDVDLAETHSAMGAVEDALGDILPVRRHCAPSSFCLFDVAARLRGIQQLMLDMYDRPKWLHTLMRFLSDEELHRRRKLEREGLLTLNNRNHYVDSGGIAYTHDLPGAGFDGHRVQLCDLWCHSAAQAASEIGPHQHEEFILEYELPILRTAGLCAYGCCEPYTRKFDMLKRRIPNLRRVSVSPWCDVQTAADALHDNYLFSWKPNPAMLVGAFSAERFRDYVRRTLDITRGCCLEIILKDTITLEGKPERLYESIRVTREAIGA